jgi:hypothetical protein
MASRSGVVPRTVAKRLARYFAFGRSRVLTPVPPNLVWCFFHPHHHIVGPVLVPYPQIRRMLGQKTHYIPSAPTLTIPIPNLPVSVAEKALESFSSPPPFGGE